MTWLFRRHRTCRPLTARPGLSIVAGTAFHRVWSMARDGAGLDGLAVQLAGGEVLLVEPLAREGVAPLGVARPVEDVDRPDAALEQVERA
ncbi:MAG: hypothetical protein JW839_06025, partial [Candidatus Lokiarchaeota archaeon]|nr:hypothetical protein [Candidatus Lokiarchaeota archaeon]